MSEIIYRKKVLNTGKCLCNTSLAKVQSRVGSRIETIWKRIFSGAERPRGRLVVRQELEQLPWEGVQEQKQQRDVAAYQSDSSSDCQNSNWSCRQNSSQSNSNSDARNTRRRITPNAETEKEQQNTSMP